MPLTADMWPDGAPEPYVFWTAGTWEERVKQLTGVSYEFYVCNAIGDYLRFATDIHDNHAEKEIGIQNTFDWPTFAAIAWWCLYYLDGEVPVDYTTQMSRARFILWKLRQLSGGIDFIGAQGKGSLDTPPNSQFDVPTQCAFLDDLNLMSPPTPEVNLTNIAYAT